MMACVILLAALVVVGAVLRIFHKEDAVQAPSDNAAPGAPEGECCGTHAVCEKINSRRLAPVEYYDDEELDAYAGRNPEDYTAEETDEFREVMFTLLPGDVAGWGVSLEKRGINLPLALRDEYILLLEG